MKIEYFHGNLKSRDDEHTYFTSVRTFVTNTSETSNSKPAGLTWTHACTHTDACMHAHTRTHARTHTQQRMGGGGGRDVSYIKSATYTNYLNNVKNWTSAAWLPLVVKDEAIKCTCNCTTHSFQNCLKVDAESFPKYDSKCELFPFFFFSLSLSLLVYLFIYLFTIYLIVCWHFFCLFSLLLKYLFIIFCICLFIYRGFKDSNGGGTYGSHSY